LVDSVRYKEWLEMAKKDMKSAHILFEHEADFGIVCFHCQQTLEKYLKGYLIFKTGLLEQGHNLIKLCRKAASYDKSFNELIKDCSFVNTFYIETRYPAEDPLSITNEDVLECFSILEKIIDKIDKGVNN
jgi:HEPN domain-containing protein